MPLSEQKLLQSYRMLHQIFPEDLHIARPFIQMLQHNESCALAADLALSMARRMLANGHAAHATSFLTLCRQLNHPDSDDIDSLYDMARFSIADSDSEPGKSFALIEQLSDAEGVDFIRQGTLLQIAHHDVIVHQGESSKTFYLILDGNVDVQISLNSGKSIIVQTLLPGDFFGEFACVYKLRRSASVVATGSGLLLEFSDHAIDQLMHTAPIAGDYLIRTVQSRMVDAMTHSLPAFTELPEADRLWITEESPVCEYNCGDAISCPEPTQPVCQILLSGSASMQLPDGGNVALTTGMMFGNISPHICIPSQASVVASEHTLICSMPGNIFHAFMNVYAGFEQQVKILGTSLHQKYQSTRSA